MSAVLGKSQNCGRKFLVSARMVLLAGSAGMLLTGCVGDLTSTGRHASKAPKTGLTKGSSSDTQLADADTHVSNKTKFSSREFGVEGSPRVTTVKRPRKGGGRYQIGKPYKIKGRWYKPAHNPDLREVGLASWYGANFHGRLTANGEIYDQYALTAAHPTMPLPSYATVTNLENGRKITVRVNDRGPYAHNRVIDLSARAAKLLGYDHQGVAKVKVEYAGKARMDGLDEPMLLASYVGPGGFDRGAPPENQSGGGTMLAMADTPEQGGANAAISTSFEGSTLALSGSTVMIPTARPTIFEGISLNEGDAIVYRVAPQVAGPRPVNVLSFMNDSELQKTLLANHIADLKREFVAYHGTKPDKRTGLQLGVLDEPALSAVKMVLDDLSATNISQDGRVTRLIVREADANTALVRLHKAGLVSAFIK